MLSVLGMRAVFGDPAARWEHIHLPVLPQGGSRERAHLSVLRDVHPPAGGQREGSETCGRGVGGENPLEDTTDFYRSYLLGICWLLVSRILIYEVRLVRSGLQLLFRRIRPMYSISARFEKV